MEQEGITLDTCIGEVCAIPAQTPTPFVMDSGGMTGGNLLLITAIILFLVIVIGIIYYMYNRSVPDD